MSTSLNSRISCGRDPCRPCTCCYSLCEFICVSHVVFRKPCVLGVLHIPSGSYPSAISSSTEFPELSGEASDGDVSHTAEWSKVSHSLNVSGKSLYACIHTMYVPDDPGNQKRALDSLEMELWMVVSHPVGSKEQLNHRSISRVCYLLLK